MPISVFCKNFYLYWLFGWLSNLYEEFIKVSRLVDSCGPVNVKNVYTWTLLVSRKHVNFRFLDKLFKSFCKCLYRDYFFHFQELLSSKEDDKNWKGIIISIGCISLILMRDNKIVNEIKLIYSFFSWNSNSRLASLSICSFVCSGI